MRWPTPQDYNEAIQTPTVAFADKELMAGHPQLTALGLPRPMTGSFASVYRMHCLGRDWAVRCFLQNISDQHVRYEHLSNFVMNDDLEYTVGFDYLPEGIRVHGKWYPALKMEWVEGQPFVEYIEEHLMEPDKLLQLAAEFKLMMERLEQAGIAHGDLQHGNIIVTSQGIRLVDYDGMFVPALAGRESNELGHRNFQHPARSRKHFDATMDNFSAWLIYLSLQMIAHDFHLWDELRGGDDCLLLRQSDFKEPSESPAFARLKAHSSQDIRNAAEMLLAMLELEPSYIQSLREANGALPIHSIHVPNWFEKFSRRAGKWAREHMHVELGHKAPSSPPQNPVHLFDQLLNSPPQTSTVPTITHTANGNLPEWLSDALERAPRATNSTAMQKSGSTQPQISPPSTSNSSVPFVFNRARKARKQLRLAKDAYYKGKLDETIKLAEEGLQVINGHSENRLEIEICTLLIKVYKRKGVEATEEFKWLASIANFLFATTHYLRIKGLRGGFLDRAMNEDYADVLIKLSHSYERVGEMRNAAKALQTAIYILKVYPQQGDRVWSLQNRLSELSEFN